MKNLKFKFGAYLYNLVVVLMVAFLTVGVTPAVLVAAPVVALATGTMLHCLGMPMYSLMAVQVEIWEKHIEEEIFKDNEFLRISHNADSNVIDSRVVHIPQSGGSGNVVKNRTDLPATVRKRVDTDVVYVLDEYTTDPVLIPNADKHELSYDKRSSVLGEDQESLKETIAEETLINWVSSPAYGNYAASTLPATSILETSGEEISASAPSATGNRKAARLNDLQTVKSFLKAQGVWRNGQMYGLLPDAMEAQLFPAESEITAKYMGYVTEAERRMGVIYKVQGFNLMTRASVYRVAADDSIVVPEALGATTDDEAALFWYKGAVELAHGGVKAFSNEGDPQFYGDVYSFLARLGGRARRADFKGIALLKQAKTV